MADEKPRRTGGSRWKRPPTKVYEYNYDVGQHYYQPMIRHLDKKSSGVATELPGPKTFAERLAEDPLYGRSKPVNYRQVLYRSFFFLCSESAAHSSSTRFSWGRRQQLINVYVLAGRPITHRRLRAGRSERRHRLAGHLEDRDSRIPVYKTVRRWPYISMIGAR